MDPSDFNRAVMLEHFPMHTVEDVISKIPKSMEQRPKGRMLSDAQADLCIC